MTAIDLNRIQKNVYALMVKYPETIDDTPMLLERYWLEYDGWNENNSLYWNLTKSTRAETILRRAREVREMALVKLGEDEQKRRDEAFNNERERPQAVSWLDD